MAKLKVYIKDDQHQVKIPVGVRLLIRRCCQAVLTTEGFGYDTEVSVSFVDNKEIRKLNNIYRNKDSETDVLSFPLSEGDKLETNPETGFVVLGDIVISMETAVKQAKMYGHVLEREIAFLTVHSMLHLLGYDHETSPLDQRKMREKEESVLEKLGFARDTSYVTPEEQA
ncbi:MAG: rRNA maturation RNase YbeY [Oscillospiraceae bacterium]|nr:rRNA maturation RNase YbeY [Oscillospiraceae bacterium]